MAPDDVAEAAVPLSVLNVVVGVPVDELVSMELNTDEDEKLDGVGEVEGTMVVVDVMTRITVVSAEDTVSGRDVVITDWDNADGSGEKKDEGLRSSVLKVSKLVVSSGD